jgi:peptidoglycan hydrolase CwlO-like protein
LQDTQAQLENTQAQLQCSQTHLQDTQAQLQCSQTHLQDTQAQLQCSRERIKAMESSKFWKLRKAWFKLKQLLGLKGDE